jgi:hypothetical protein
MISGWRIKEDECSLPALVDTKQQPGPTIAVDDGRPRRPDREGSSRSCLGVGARVRLLVRSLADAPMQASKERRSRHF